MKNSDSKPLEKPFEPFDEDKIQRLPEIPRPVQTALRRLHEAAQVAVKACYLENLKMTHYSQAFFSANEVVSATVSHAVREWKETQKLAISREDFGKFVAMQLRDRGNGAIGREEAARRVEAALRLFFE